MAKIWRRVRIDDPEAVTRRAGDEVDPRSVGLTEADIEAIWSSVVRLYKTAIHPGIAICIRRRGEVVLHRTIGHARGNAPDDPLDGDKVLASPDTVWNFFSGSKAVTAVLIHMLQERELIHVDEPVATFIPEFAKHRKHRITIRDVLTHRSGIPNIPTDLVDLDILHDRDRLVATICELEPRSKPGQEVAYHAVTGGFVLGEILHRVTGDDIRAFMHSEVSDKLGFPRLNYGVPEDQLQDVALEAFTGPIPTWPHKNLLENALGFDMPTLVDFANDPRLRTGIMPAGNCMGTANEVCQFFEMLRCGGELNGVRVCTEETVHRATKPATRGEVDRMLMMPIPYSAGFMLGSDLVGFYGPKTGKAYGHLGFTNVLGWADPERDLSVALMNNGKPLIALELLAWLDVMRTISTRVPRDGKLS
jgi:CubicO group peptidase (beta-lactamase class C family)